MTDRRPPLVTVVIPAHDAERTLAAAVRSVLAQSIADLELIIVDDGSQDRTAEIAAGVADARCRLLRQPHRGVAAARNAGALAGSGPYVAFLDADDVWLPEKIGRQMERLERQPALLAVQCGAYYVDDGGQILSVHRCRDGQVSLGATARLEGFPAFPSTVVIRRDAFVRVGLFDERLDILEDWDFALRIAREGQLDSVADPLVLYRVHARNRSRDIGLHVDSGRRLLARRFEDATLRPLRRAAYAAFYRMLAGAFFVAGDRRRAIAWGLRAICTHPEALLYFARLPQRRLARRPSRHIVPDGLGPFLLPGHEHPRRRTDGRSTR